MASRTCPIADVVQDQSYFREALDLMDRIALAIAARFVYEISEGGVGDRIPTVASLISTGVIVRSAGSVVQCLIDRLSLEEVLKPLVWPKEGYEIAKSVPQLSVGEELQEAGRVMGDDPMVSMIERCSNHLKAFCSGEKSGTQVLFPHGNTSAWERLQHSSVFMRHYAALSAILLLPSCSFGARILELGGGTGTLTRRVIEDCSRRGVEIYSFTDISHAFLRRANDRWGNQSFFHTSILDLNVDFEEQGVVHESFDAVVAVNALHLAQSIGPTLSRVARVLRPGGYLIIGEGNPGYTFWGPEIVFSFLTGWWDVETSPERPKHGFMSYEQWSTMLGASRLLVDPLHAAETFRSEWFGGAFVARKQ